MRTLHLCYAIWYRTTKRIHIEDCACASLPLPLLFFSQIARCSIHSFISLLFLHFSFEYIVFFFRCIAVACSFVADNFSFLLHFLQCMHVFFSVFHLLPSRCIDANSRPSLIEKIFLIVGMLCFFAMGTYHSRWNFNFKFVTEKSTHFFFVRKKSTIA